MNLAVYFKVLSDPTRLRLVRLLARKETPVKELADKLAVSEPTVSHHLTQLRNIGFVNIRTAGNQRFYRLNDNMIQQFKREITTFEKADTVEDDNAWIEALPFSDEDKKVLAAYTFAGRLRQIPTKDPKLMVVLNWLSLAFEQDVTYTEAQVNEIIAKYHADFATLRRNLVDYGFLRRERAGTKYWVVPEDEPRPTSFHNPPKEK